MPHNPIHPVEPTQPTKSQEQLSCEANGGKWDSVHLRCILPDKKPEPKQKPEPVKTPVQIPETPRRAPIDVPEIKFDESGKVNGVRFPDGREFLGISQEEVNSLVAKFTGERTLPSGTAPSGTAQAEFDLQQRQKELQETGAPVRRELDPTLEAGESMPVIGPLRVKIRKLAGGFLKDTAVGNFFDKLNPGERTEFFELEPEALRTAALTEIERIEIERGLTDSEKFGSFVESLGLGGLSNFAAEKPSENVQTILRQVKIAKTRGTNAEIKVKDGTWRQAYGEEVIDGLEADLQRFESRMKLLIQDSPELKFDSDGVNFIEDKLFEARERLFSAKINMLSGPAKDPSEIEVLIALQESIRGEDFEL